jgi:hypothetical protein
MSRAAEAARRSSPPPIVAEKAQRGLGSSATPVAVELQQCKPHGLHNRSVSNSGPCPIDVSQC